MEAVLQEITAAASDNGGLMFNLKRDFAQAFGRGFRLPEQDIAKNKREAKRLSVDTFGDKSGTSKHTTLASSFCSSRPHDP